MERQRERMERGKGEKLRTCTTVFSFSRASHRDHSPSSVRQEEHLRQPAWKCWSHCGTSSVSREKSGTSTTKMNHCRLYQSQACLLKCAQTCHLSLAGAATIIISVATNTKMVFRRDRSMLTFCPYKNYV